MKAKLLGMRKLDFSSNDGTQVQGIQAYIAFPEEGVEGVMTDKLFLRDGFAFPACEPGATLEVTYNRKGRPECIKVVSAAK